MIHVICYIVVGISLRVVESFSRLGESTGFPWVWHVAPHDKNIILHLFLKNYMTHASLVKIIPALRDISYPPSISMRVLKKPYDEWQHLLQKYTSRTNLVQPMSIDGEMSDGDECYFASLPKNWNDSHETVVHFFREAFDDPQILCESIYFRDYLGKDVVLSLTGNISNGFLPNKV